MTSDHLYAVGTRLMDDAEPSGSDYKADAFLYRDGLIIALLAVAPLRRSTLAALRVGEHLLKSGDLWVLEIPAKDMKTRQSLDFLLSRPLSARIDRYLAEFRDAIPGATKHTGLWPSNVKHPIFASVMGAVLDEVVGPDVIAALRPQPNARSIGQRACRAWAAYGGP